MPGSGFQLAHLSDLHLPFDPVIIGPRPQRLTIKQRLALLSWQRKRRHISTEAPVPALLHDLARFQPDHVAVTGDLVNLGLPVEYDRARAWLDAIGTPDRVSVVPGNHDLTAPIAAADGLDRWGAFMRDDAASDDIARFPFLRRRGPVAILGLCSGVPTRPGSAAGRLGHRQLEAATRLLDQTGAEALFRVVLIHHPPVLGSGGPRKALRDRGSLVRMLRRHGAELVLHGHHHRTSLIHLPGPAGPIPVFGVPAALAVSARPELSGWMLHQVRADDRGWHLHSTLRRFDPVEERFTDAQGWEHRFRRQ